MVFYAIEVISFLCSCDSAMSKIWWKEEREDRIREDLLLVINKITN